ncbi:MAG: peptidase M1, partial [Saprospiraceae bacterium]|nr:peptidase M1 [Saprospiraceae bacterium]
MCGVFRYRTFAAQSLPGIIPFFEAIGFMMDIDDKRCGYSLLSRLMKLAHQWWRLQLEAANVQGQNAMPQTLAQYSALMVFENILRQSSAILKLQWDEY